MKFRLLGILLLTISCGKQVNIDHTALEEASKLSTKSSSYLEGSISKMSNGNSYFTNIAAANPNSYQVTEKSSYNAQLFISKLTPGANPTNVKVQGTISSGKITISEIELR